jgi:hypothetical protein
MKVVRSLLSPALSTSGGEGGRRPGEEDLIS